MIQGFGKRSRKIKNNCKFPKHIRKYMEKEGLNPDALELLASLLKDIEFTHNQSVYKLGSSLDLKSETELRTRRIQSATSRTGTPGLKTVSQPT